MRIFAFLLNVAAIVFVIVLCISKELSKEELVVPAIFISIFVVNLLALNPLCRGGWIRLYFKRRGLEEQAKIEALKKAPPPESGSETD